MMNDPRSAAEADAATGPCPSATHTPGPWKVIGPQCDGEKIISAAKYDTIVMRPTASQSTIREPGQDDANARLIAAAPDLLTALRAYRSAQRRMLERWAEGDQNVKNGLWRDLHACEDAATDAIAKASGAA